MKYVVRVMVVLVLVGGGVYLLLDNARVDEGTDEGTTVVTEEQALPADAAAAGKPLAVDPVAVDRPAGLPDNPGAQSRPETARVTEEQRAAADQQEAKILDMARAYEAGRSDPQRREALREDMAQQLTLYSEAVLPIAMEKMESAQSPN